MYFLREVSYQIELGKVKIINLETKIKQLRKLDVLYLLTMLIRQLIKYMVVE
nr:MAG TPA: hypothetical protein [Caudoviricetes sp.]